MDRFFSKLDLRDIKIKPEGTRFLPDDDPEPEEQLAESDFDRGYVADSPLSATAVTARTWETETVYEAAPEEIAEPVAATDLHTNGAVHSHPIDASEPLYENGEVLKVSAKSRPSAVAGAIAGVVRDAGRAEVQAIGAGATNQAVKAVAIARDYLLESGIDAVCVPAFIDVTIDNEERTAIRLVVETR